MTSIYMNRVLDVRTWTSLDAHRRPPRRTYEEEAGRVLRAMGRTQTGVRSSFTWDNRYRVEIRALQGSNPENVKSSARTALTSLGYKLMDERQEGSTLLLVYGDR